MRVARFARILLAPAALALCAAASTAAPPTKEMNWLVGKPLSEARSKLVETGWEPQETALTTVKGTPERSWGEAGKLLEAGYPEVERCTGGARNYCFLNYARRGKCLRVRTLGVLRAADSEPKVHGVGDACPSKQAKR